MPFIRVSRSNNQNTSFLSFDTSVPKEITRVILPVYYMRRRQMRIKGSKSLTPMLKCVDVIWTMVMQQDYH